MKLSIDGSFGEPAQELDTDRIKFIAEDGRQMFEVVIGKDGVSFEVRGTSTCKVNGELYCERLSVEPNSSNAITIRAKKYGS